MRVLSLMRLSDTYLNDQVFRATASQSSANACMAPLMQLDQLLGNDETGLTQVLTQFLGDLQRCEARPESIALRQQWLGSTQQLVTRFQMLNQQLLGTAEQQVRQISNLISGVNQLSGAIAALNDEIAELSGLNDIYGGGNCADLMDQRDALINQLSDQLSVEVDRQSNNSVNLLVVSQQGAVPLVSGPQCFLLSLGSNESDPTGTAGAGQCARHRRSHNSEGRSAGRFANLLPRWLAAGDQSTGPYGGSTGRASQ